jgi:hypothetical protein
VSSYIVHVAPGPLGHGSHHYESLLRDLPAPGGPPRGPSLRRRRRARHAVPGPHHALVLVPRPLAVVRGSGGVERRDGRGDRAHRHGYLPERPSVVRRRRENFVAAACRLPRSMARPTAATSWWAPRCSTQVRGGDGPPDRREAESKSLIDTDGHDTHSGGRQPVQLRARHGGGHGAARVAAYKVCWKQGCAGSDILVGIDQAITDSVNVILLSLGGGWSLSTRSPSPCSASSAKGIVLSTSANNDAPGKSTVSNATPWVITVDASTMNRQFPASSETANVLSARRCTRATRTGR